MSHANRNFVIAYIVLVGLPVLGLVGVLKNGRTLTAPFSVDGAWKIEAAANSSSCANFLSSLSAAPFSISQSGTSLVVSLNNGAKTAIGTLEDKSIRAEFAGEEDSNCESRSLVLAATLNPQSEPRTMHGTLTVENCPSCSIEFNAVRQPRNISGGAH